MKHLNNNFLDPPAHSYKKAQSDPDYIGPIHSFLHSSKVEQLLAFRQGIEEPAQIADILQARHGVDHDFPKGIRKGRVDTG